MKLKKIIAAVAAAAVAVSTIAINTFAFTASKNDEGIFTVIVKGENGWTSATGADLSEVYGATFHVEFDADAIANGTWIGGAVGVNSKSTGWKVEEWATSDKPIIADVENGTITYLADKAPFSASDEWAWFVLQPYDNAEITITSVDILGKDGKVLSDEAGAAPAETEAAEADEAAETEADEATEAEADEAADDTAEDEAAAPTETEAAPVETTAAPAAETTTTTPATGNAPAAVMASVMALAGAAVIASRKRK